MSKVLLVSSKKSLSLQSTINAITSLGHECSFFNHRKGIVYENAFARKLIRNIPVLKIIKRKAVEKINKELVYEADRIKPEILLVCLGENIFPETINKIREKNIVTVNWFTEFLKYWHIIEKIAPAYTHFFSSDSITLRKLEKIGLKNCSYLPEAIEKKWQNPFKNRKEKYSVTFIGSYNPKVWANREEFLNAVKDLGLNIWGPPIWLKTSLKDYYRGKASGDKMLQIYKESKIALDIPWDDGIAEGIGRRPFEVMASGACFLMHDIRKDIRRIFNNTQYVPFSDKDDLRSKVDYYLKHDAERRAIARAGYETTIRDHTFLARIKKITSLL